MSLPDEQRVIEALRAFTGGLIVTDQEIAIAESRLRDSVEPPSPRRRLVILAAAVAAVLVAGFFIAQAVEGRENSSPPAHTPSSPADTLKEALQADAYDLGSEDFTAGAQPTAQDMAGFWLLREPYSAPLLVDADGDYWMGGPIEPAGFSRSTLAGDTWTRRFPDGNACGQPNGFSLPWQAALASDGSLHLMFTGSTNACTPADDREVWDRVTPGSPVSDYLLAAADQAHWLDAPRSFRWQGLYVAPATGHVLEALDDETYRYFESLTAASLAAGDQGEIFADGAKFSGSCAGGTFEGTAKVAQLPGVTGYLGSYDAVRITTLSDTCESGVIAAQDVWVNITG